MTEYQKKKKYVFVLKHYISFQIFPPHINFPELTRIELCHFIGVLKNKQKKKQHIYIKTNPQPVDFDEFVRKWIYIKYYIQFVDQLTKKKPKSILMCLSEYKYTGGCIYFKFCHKNNKKKTNFFFS